MGYRWIASTLPIAAAAMVFAACGTTTESGNGSATASRPPVGAQMTPSDAVQSTVALPGTTVTPNGPAVGGDTATVGATSTSTSTATVADTSSTSPPGDDVDTSEYSGRWQRHGSYLDLEPDGTGTILIGNGAVDGEKWSLTWAPTDHDIVITVGPQISKSGAGLDGLLAAGQTITGVRATDPANITVLRTTGIRGESLTQGWCMPKYGSAAECGA